MLFSVRLSEFDLLTALVSRLCRRSRCIGRYGACLGPFGIEPKAKAIEDDTPFLSIGHGANNGAASRDNSICNYYLSFSYSRDGTLRNAHKLGRYTDVGIYNWVKRRPIFDGVYPASTLCEDTFAHRFA